MKNFAIGQKLNIEDRFFFKLSHDPMEEPYEILEIQDLRNSGQCLACIGHNLILKITDQFHFAEFWASAAWFDISVKDTLGDHTPECIQETDLAMQDLRDLEDEEPL